MEEMIIFSKNFKIAFCWIVLSLLSDIKLYAAKQLELEVVAEVDGQLDIERIDNGGSVDVFAGRNVSYMVHSNLGSDVTATITSDNGWKLKHESENLEIPYGVYRGREKLNNGAEPATTEIQQNEFSTGGRSKQYQLDLVFKADENVKLEGKYRDRVVITVAPKN
jgi:hypothetical protein